MMKGFQYLTTIFISCLFSYNSLSQNKIGVKFVHGLGWDQILKMAQDENKMIFVECNASWCSPCKQMEKDVFATGDVGEFINDKFISLKLQLDSTVTDPVEIKYLYGLASNIKSEFGVNAFPTFLFFSSTGLPMHRGVGYKAPKEFINLASDALVPSKQYYTLLRTSKGQSPDYSIFPELINMALALEDKKSSDSIAKIYKVQYLLNLSDRDLFTEKNLNFIFGHLNILNSNDRFFTMFYSHPHFIDSIVNRAGVSDQVVKIVITNEELNKYLYNDGQIVNSKPNWIKYYNNIKNIYNKDYANELVLNCQIRYYRRLENWKKFSNVVKRKNIILPPKLSNDIMGDSWMLNSYAWDFFLGCTDTALLNEALKWSNLAVKMAEEEKRDYLFAYFDTNASLLYKLGRVQDAISQESKAVEYAEAKNNIGYANEFKGVIEKMKNGIPIYDAKWRNN